MSNDLTILPADNTLMAPNLAAGQVSRSEFVNMMVVEYVEQQETRSRDLNQQVNDMDLELQADLQPLVTDAHQRLVACAKARFAAWIQATRDLLGSDTTFELLGLTTPLFVNSPFQVSAVVMSDKSMTRTIVTGNTGTSHHTFGYLAHQSPECQNPLAQFFSSLLHKVETNRKDTKKSLTVYLSASAVQGNGGYRLIVQTEIQVEEFLPAGWFEAMDAYVGRLGERAALMKEYIDCRDSIQNRDDLEKKALARLTRHAMGTSAGGRHMNLPSLEKKKSSEKK